MKNTVCMSCRSTALEKFLDLGEQPNGNFFPAADEVENEPRFPFSMLVCQDCWQVQIEEFPSPEFMFSNHPYITGVNMPVVDHFHRMADRLIEKYELKKNSLVLDIGCNDGTLLGIFADRGMRTFGVDPGQRTGKLARENGVVVAETFWTEASARAIRSLNFRPDLITATSVFYHLQDIHDFIRGLRQVMNERTVFSAQCVYLLDVLEKNQFDHFYHEHTMIHAVAPLKRLFESHGMRLLDVERYDVHGGSFVLDVGLENCVHPTRSSIEETIRAEENAGLFEISTYRDFTARVEKNRDDLRELLETLKAEGKTVDALGAPLKGSTLMNYCGIGPDLIRRATEVNEFKIGKVTPGTHVPIVDENAPEIRADPPDYYLLLAWNFADFFRKKYHDYLARGGRFILPHPELQVI
ncbi:MAG: class I SAM-dependent methyltransferase [Verrucomicrobiota bacterium]